MEGIRRLSPRQLEVADLIARGYTNAEIARELTITKGTAANHVRYILERLGARSRAEVAAQLVAHRAHQMEEILGGTPIVLFKQDRDLRYIWVFNAAISYVSNDVIGKTDAEVLPAKYADQLTAIKRSVLDTVELRRDIVLTLVEGMEVCHDLVVKPLFGPAGQIRGIVGICWQLPDEFQDRRPALPEAL